MKHTGSSLPSFRYLILLASLLFILEAGLVLWASLPWLIGRVNADDFYYYLVLAQNMVAGLGATFDGLELTNGFHPLYWVFVCLLALFPIDHPAFLVKTSLIMLLAFHQLIGLILGWSFHRLGWEQASWLSGLLWLLNPWGAVIALQGVETTIAVFWWSLLIFIWLDYQLLHPLRPKLALLLGLLLGLSILTRTDGLLLLGVVLVLESWNLLFPKTASMPRLPRLYGLCLICGGAILLTSPWWWWNWQTFGAVMQVSGKAVFLMMHGFDWLQPSFILRKTTLAVLMYLSYGLAYGLAAWLSLIFMRWLIRYHAGRLPVRQGGSPKNEYECRTVYQLLTPLLWLTALALFLWYAVWQWHIQAWYLLPTMLILTIFVSLVAQKLALNQQAFYQVVGLIVFINLLVLLGFSLSIGFGYPRQERAYYIAQWVQENTDPEDIIGTWNSGIVAYFTTRSVINIDGVVNNSIYDYKITHQTNNISGLMPYFKARRIRYLTDYEASDLADPAALGLRRVYQSTEHDFHIYEIIEDR